MSRSRTGQRTKKYGIGSPEFTIADAYKIYFVSTQLLYA